MSYRGWPAEAMEFFEALEADNTKSFWQAHVADYQRWVKGPMEDLLGELELEFGPGKVFRPYRDVRFSKDKSPYKTNIAATIGPFGYVTLSAEGLGVGSGMYMMGPDQLARYRGAVAAPESGEVLAEIVGTLRGTGYTCGAHDPLKTAPRGYSADHPRIELLRGKGITVWQSWAPGAWLGTSGAKSRVVDLLRAAEPLNQWLAEHVGDSSIAARG